MADSRKSAAPGRGTRGAREDHLDERSPTILSRKAALELTSDQKAALDAARHLAEHGVPLFVAKPLPGGKFRLPDDWQLTEPDPSVVDTWVPGMALCAVTGHTIDVVDVDPRSGGSLASLEEVMPVVYGEAETPSGGTHHLIASLGVRKFTLPGIDVLAGDSDGEGRGFVFIAPTVRASKVDGVSRAYAWTQPPDLGPLLIDEDTSGAALAAMRPVTTTDPEYTGPEYARLAPEQQREADAEVSRVASWWREHLQGVEDWPEGQTDDQGRGWELLARDLAWSIAQLVAAPWTTLDEDEGRALHDELLPAALAENDKCAGKWERALGRAHGGLPPWDKRDSPEDDFEPFEASRAEQLDAIFSSSDVLAHIRQYAHGSGRGAMPMLGFVLARVLAEVPPSVVLPGARDGAVASRASLNLGFAFVGRSGAGKSDAEGMSEELLGIDQGDIQRTPSSGEGLIQSYLTDEKVVDDKGRLVKTGQKVLTDDPRRLFNIDEVEQLAQLGRRSGATLGSNLRTMLMGKQEGTETASEERRRNLRSGTYRMVVAVGVQPELSGALLDGQSAGLPQRFVWVRVADPTIPASDDRPAELPAPLNFQLPPFELVNGQFVLDYPKHLKKQVRDADHIAQMGGDDSKAHLNLTRLKVAAALALLHGELSISDRWWEVSGLIIDESERVQAECRAVLAQAAQEASTTYATRQARAHDTAQSVVIDDNLRKAVSQTMTNLRRVAKKAGSPGPFKWTEVRPSSRYRRWESATEDIVSEMRHQANVRVEESVAQNGWASYSFWFNERK